MNKIILYLNKFRAGLAFIFSGKKKIKRTRVMLKRFFWPDQILHVFIEMTNFCNARCTTCLQKNMKRERGIMDFERFKTLIDLIKKQDVAWAHLYGIGESYVVPDALKYFDYALRELKNNGVDAILITNGELISELPRDFSQVYISFNAGIKKSFEEITGLDFEKTAANIRRLSRDGQLGNNVTIRMLVSEKTEKEISDFQNLFKDVSCNLEISYKYDNQHGEIDDLTVDSFRKNGKRVPCNYVLNTVNICWNGDIILCPHDFEGEIKYGNIFNDGWKKIVDSKLRKKIIKEHIRGDFQGLCQQCNYNCLFEDQVKKIKSAN